MLNQLIEGAVLKTKQLYNNLWILHSGQIYKLKSFMKNIIVYKYQNPGAHRNIVSPARPLFLGATKRGRPK